MGVCGAGPAGLVEMKTEFLELVDRMGRWPGYGDLPWLWENGRPVGICRDVWGDASGVWPYGKTAIPYGEMACVWEAAESHGGAAKTYGKCHGIWEPMPAHGEAARAAWGAKITLKPGIWERWRPAGFACFYEFLAGGGGMAFATVKAWHSLPSRLRTRPAASVAAPKIPRLRHLALASS